MRKLALYLILVTVISEFAMAQEHAGFRKAINNGDIKTAISLKKAGIKDIYCPETMSPASAVKLYREELRNKPYEIISNCSEGFLDKIRPLSCANYNNIELCKYMLMTSPIEKWEPMLDQIIEKDVHKHPSVHLGIEIHEGYSRLYDKIDQDPLYPQKTALSQKLKVISLGNSPKSPECYADESCSAKKLTKAFVNNSEISNITALFFCSAHPDIDKKIEAENGFNILNCSEILDTYSKKCSSANANETYTLNEDPRIFKCENKDNIWSWQPNGIKIGNTIWATQDVKIKGSGALIDPIANWYRNLTETAKTEGRNSALRKYPIPCSKIDRDPLRKSLCTNNANPFSKEIFDFFHYLGFAHSFEQAQNICPDGWTLPTEEQFNELAQTTQSASTLNSKWKFNLRKFSFNQKHKSFQNMVYYWLANGNIGRIDDYDKYHLEKGIDFETYKRYDNALNNAAANISNEENEIKKLEKIIEDEKEKLKETRFTTNNTILKAENDIRERKRNIEYTNKVIKDIQRKIKDDNDEIKYMYYNVRCVQGAKPAPAPAPVQTQSAPTPAQEARTATTNNAAVTTASAPTTATPVSTAPTKVVATEPAASTSATAQATVATEVTVPASTATVEPEQKQEQATEAAESAYNIGDLFKKVKWQQVVSVSAALAGGGLAYYFNKKAKDATANPPANAAEYQKGYDDAGKNQTYRNISIGLAAAGLVAFGITFIF
ncbi:hypothetical protein [Fibrobacter sp. UWB7]|uniref:hypothetical protein n=1 Tax=Fibrobacter sp. UWB7 TaxID=1896206 RepID=UPI000919C563|nr:hypothetical protein [Fibrobacter sp. UWB7]SHM70954.1 major paralogous domain-containing protein [Fibrobacter sp. UWB7]